MSASNKTSQTKKKTFTGFSDFEREAMKNRAHELLMDKSEGESALLAKIATMVQPDKGMAERIHALVKEHAPELEPKTWYGMPAYANKDGKVVCFFQDAIKFKARYATFGFNDAALLDDGDMWPTSFALKKLTAVEEKKIVTLLKKAVKK